MNEESTRYSEVRDEFELFTEGRAQSTDNKQGSSGLAKIPFENFSELLEHGDPDALGYLAVLRAGRDSSSIPYFEELSNENFQTFICENANQSIELAYDTYRTLLAAGVAREQARNVLPLATYSQMYWKTDLHNLLHFLRLRLDSHAQLEIRQLAEAIASIVKAWCPIAWEAFEDYNLGAVTLSKQEYEILRSIALAYADRFEIPDISQSKLSKREQKEFISKWFK